MRFLIVFCHPSEISFSAALFDQIKDALLKADNDVKSIDLYREKFDPVMSLDEWNSYIKVNYDWFGREYSG